MYYIDGYFLADKNPAGLHRYSLELLKRIDEDSLTNFKLVVPEGELFYTPKNLEVIVLKGHNIRRWKWDTYPRYVKKMKGQTLDFAYAQQTKKVDVCSILDCIILNYKVNFKSFRSKLFRIRSCYVIRRSAKKARIVLALTNSSKKEILDSINVDPSKIKIVSCGWEHIKDIEPSDGILGKFGLLEKVYYFALGSRYEHKNVKWILKNAELNPDETYVITGKNLEDPALNKRLLKNVIFTGYLPDGEVKSLMTHAKAFLQPSFYEGFGIPPLEALALNKKIVVSDIPVMREIYGDAAYYLDPLDPTLKLDALLDKSVGSSGEVLEKYTWDNAYKNLIEALNEHGN